MAKLNLEALRNKIAEATNNESMVESAKKILAEHGISADDSVIAGQISKETATEIEAMIDGLVEDFKSTKKFDWKVHILNPIWTVAEAIRKIDIADRQGLEELLTELIQNLFKQYAPDLPWIAKIPIIGGAVKSLIIGTAIPAGIDFVFDRVYGED